MRIATNTMEAATRKVFCPAVIGFAASLVEEIKEIKEIMLLSLCAALSAISALSAGHYYLMRIVFYCPTEIKEIKEIFVPTRNALSAISALSVGNKHLPRENGIVPQSSALPLRSSKK